MEIKHFSISSKSGTSKYKLHLKQKNQDHFFIELNNSENEINKTIDAKILKYDQSKELLYFEINQKIYLAKLSYNNDKSINISLNNSEKTFTVKENKITNSFFNKIINNAEQTSAKKNIKSSISGRVTKCLVKTGDKIVKNQALLIIESMKIENEIRSDVDGFIKTISISEGDLVKQNQELITLSYE